MDDAEQKKLDEQKLEEEASKEAKEEEVRANIIAEYGFDEVDDAERINKLVSRELDHRNKLSTAIRQKIDWRTQAQKGKETPPASKKDDDQGGDKLTPEEIDRRVKENFENRDLDEMDYPKEIKEEIKRVAKIQGVSVKQAARDPYIQNRIAEHERTQKADEAAISRKNRSGGKKVYTLDNPPDVDMSTEEGRKEWDEWKKWASTQESMR